MSDLLAQVEDFKKEVAVRKGTYDKAILALFAYATEVNPNRPPISAYLDATMGGPSTRASVPGSRISDSGKVDFDIVSVARDVPGKPKKITVRIDKPTEADIASLLSGSHPFAKENSKNFQFQSGKDLCYLTVHFDDGFSMVIAASRGLSLDENRSDVEYVGVEYYLMKNGDMADTSGIPVRKTSIVGEYDLRAVDDAPEGQPSPPTHVVEIVVN